jgi:hypothetical protein
MIYSKSSALLLLDLIAAAYELALGLPFTLPDGFSPAVPIRIAGVIPELLEHDAMPIWGFSTWKDTQQYIVFRGTRDFPEWVADFLPLPLRPHAHYGFHSIYEAIRGSVTVSPDAIITGHSLGAAIASLCYADGGGQLMTFGGPRVGDSLFAKTLKGTIRVCNQFDIVPDVPLPPLFRHGGTEVQVYGPGSRWDALLSHHVTSYRAGVLAQKE